MSSDYESKETQNNMTEMAKKGKTETKKSITDWYEYIESHPLQSMLFGVTVYFALKGIFED